VTAPVSLVDIEPTVLMLAGAPADRATFAWNLLPFLTRGDRAANPERPMFLYADITDGVVRHEARGVVLGRYKLVRDLSTRSLEMFDLVADPDEKTDVSAQHPAEWKELRRVLEGWEQETALHRNVTFYRDPDEDEAVPDPDAVGH
jgi:arylsulfatase A-like enzyme